MIQFIVRENFILKKIIERRNEGFIYKNGLFIKEFEKYNPQILSQFKERYYEGFFKYMFSEKGGEAPVTEDSFAEIVCSSYGEPLKPIKTFEKFVDMNSPHALFVGYDLCVVRTFYKGKSVRFNIMNYKIDKQTGEYSETLIWEGIYDTVKKRMPLEFQCFDEPIKAGIRKMQDYRCAKVYYKQESEW